MSLHTLSVAELAAGLRQKQFSATELARHFIARSEAHNGLLNGYITLTPERALADAAAADARLASGRPPRSQAFRWPKRTFSARTASAPLAAAAC